MQERTYVCAGCGVTGTAGPGQLPKWCSLECRKAAVRRELRQTCVDCGCSVELSPRGRYPKRCGGCRKHAPDPRVRAQPRKLVHGRLCEACKKPIAPERDRSTRFCDRACKVWASRRPGDLRPQRTSITCAQCSEEFTPKARAKYAETRFCSKKCYYRDLHLSRPFGEWRVENPYQPRWTNCVACGVDTLAPGGGTLKGRLCPFCQKNKLTRARRANLKLRYRRLRNASVEGVTFTRLEIFERDSWICQLCGLPVDQDLRRPNLWSPSLDHDIPIVKGGMHVPENVQLAHWICNSRKRDRIT